LFRVISCQSTVFKFSGLFKNCQILQYSVDRDCQNLQCSSYSRVFPGCSSYRNLQWEFISGLSKFAVFQNYSSYPGPQCSNCSEIVFCSVQDIPGYSVDELSEICSVDYSEIVEICSVQNCSEIVKQRTKKTLKHQQLS
jgi:hypothetical protein